MKKLLLCIIMLALVLCACQTVKEEETLKLIVTEDTISQLEEYPNLKKVDLSGSTCYAAIADYMARHPEVEVIYTVALGGATVNSTMGSLVLPHGSFDFTSLVENLKYMPKLATLHLPATELSTDQLSQLQTAYPKLDVKYTLKINGVEMDSSTTKADLSGISPEALDKAIEKLQMLGNIQTIQLMDKNGHSELTPADVKKLQTALPKAFVEYSFDLFGQTVSTGQERVEFVKIDIGNEGEAEIRAALDILTSCTYFLLDDCGLDNEVVAAIRADFPDTKVVWRVFHHYTTGETRERSWLTDTKVLRAVYHVNDTNSHLFNYLTEVEFVDLGHNTKMHDLTFLSYMPNLEICILSGSEISDLSPLANSKKLKFLELAWCGWLKDISPLAGCESLQYLNLGHTRVKDISPIENCPIELLHFVDSGRLAGFTEAKWKDIQSRHPDWWITYSPISSDTANPYGVGWRYEKNNKYTAAYKRVREVFNLDAIDQEIAGGKDEPKPTEPKPTEPPADQPVVTPPTPPVVQGPTYTNPTGDASVEKLAQVMTDLTQLDKYVNLKQVDLSGSTCYADIMAYIQSHPRVRVLYTVSLGGKHTAISHTTTALSLEAGSFDYTMLLENLQYLPKLAGLSLPATSLTAQQLTALENAYPRLKVTFTLATQGTELNAEITSADLSHLTLQELLEQLPGFPNVRYVELMDAEGKSQLSISDVKQLQTALPQVTFHYSFQLFGKLVSTTDARIVYEKVSIGNAGEAQIRQALDILKGCNYFLLDSCGIDNTVMDGIRRDYPNTKVVWRVFHYYTTGQTRMRSWLTDTKVLRAVYHVDDSNSPLFNYLTEVQYVDLGHNTTMKDLTFLSYMPDLEICILSGSPITDLSPLANCKKLEFLEIAWCGLVTDISPLAQCDSLRYLNLGHTRVKDLTPLKGLGMEMLSFVNSGNRVGFDAAKWNEIQAMLPGCWITWQPLSDENATPYSTGWRFRTINGRNYYTYIYRLARDVFGYDGMV